ncbi:MAG TPA: hypothetical protein VI819_02460 [Patescibacteria group bacterium]|nr:hypothetical protein [Patescibacteria group bacterium]
MSSVILTNWTVFYSDDTGAGNGYKQIRWTGAGAPETNTNTANELYSAVADLFSVPAQNNANDTVPMQAVTPTVYNIGSFDAGDLEPWFIDPVSIRHLTGGSLESVNWTRDLTARTGSRGIVKIPRSGSNIVSGDVGTTITNDTDGDTGTLLYVETSYLWIRPTNNLAGNDWDSTGTTTITCNTHSDSQTGASTNGERLWSNIYTLGTIAANTRIYIYQNFSPITNFWGDGHVDRLYLVNDGFDAGLIDDGLLTIFARQYGILYDHYSIDVTLGGRNPVPLATSDDTNNDTGYRSMTITGATGNYIEGEVISNGTNASGIVTLETGDPTTTLYYYLVGDLTTDFSTSQTITGATSSVTGTSGTFANNGPTALSGITITFGQTQEDIGVGGNQPYDVSINCGGYLLSQIYEYLKYVTRGGNISDIDSGGQTVTGQRYITAGDVRLSYDSQTVNFLEGATLTGQSSGATGIITADHDAGTTGTLIVRDVRGTFQDNENIQDDQGTPGNADIIATGGIESTLVQKAAPFGTFAGGVFFGARGVWIHSMHSDDANNYELIDSNGVVRNPPLTVSISVHVENSSATAIEGAQVFVRKSGYYYSYTSAAGNNTADTDFIVTGAVDTDLPQTGWLHIWDASANTKQNYRYQSWSTSTNSTFQLNTAVSGSATSTHADPTTHLVSTSTNFLTSDIEEGDTIRNTTTGAWAIVDEIVDADNITTSALSSGQWTSGDGFSFHTLAINYENAVDKVDIPIFNGQTNASGNVSSTYGGSLPISVIVRVRSNQGSPKYIPYNTSGTVTTNGYSLNAVLTQDTVAGT